LTLPRIPAADSPAALIDKNDKRQLSSILYVLFNTRRVSPEIYSSMKELFSITRLIASAISRICYSKIPFSSSVTVFFSFSRGITKWLFGGHIGSQ
jgi:hypothetical protein